MKNQILSEYQNGNFLVRLYDNGTQERICEENEFRPAFPCSLDVKITNWCDAGCSYCHEKSTEQGKHGDLNRLLEVLDPLPVGIELAIGGGNPLSHPNIHQLLLATKKKGWIANITINQVHLESQYELIKQFLQEDLIKGIGISYSSPAYLPSAQKILKLSSNVVFHLIAGINKLSDVDDLENLSKQENIVCKILILGYKNYGFGLNYYLKNKNIEKNKYLWYTQLPKFFKKENFVLSFDNLAVQQLNIRRFFTSDSWDEFYLGDDFTTSMYIDAVEGYYGSSSTAEKRVKFEEKDLLTFFKQKE